MKGKEWSGRVREGMGVGVLCYQKECVNIPEGLTAFSVILSFTYSFTRFIYYFFQASFAIFRITVIPSPFAYHHHHLYIITITICIS